MFRHLRKTIGYLFVSILTVLAVGGSGLTFANEDKENATTSWVDPYVRDLSFGEIQISPDGKHFAATLPLENRRELVIIRRSDMKVTGRVGLQPKKFVDKFVWVNPDRLVFQLADSNGYLGGLKLIPSIYGINVDGKGQGVIAGLDKDIGVSGFATAIKQTDRQPVDLRGRLKAESRKVLVKTDDRNTSQTQLALMDIYSGSIQRVFGFSSAGNEFVSVDPKDGEVKLSFQTDRFDNQTVKVRSNDKAEWRIVNDESISDQSMRLLGFLSDGKSVLMQESQDSGPDSVISVDLFTGKKTLLVTDKRVDPGEILLSPIDKSPYAMVLRDGFPRIHYLDKESIFSKALRRLSVTFKEDFVLPVSYTDDGNLGVFLVQSDKTPGTFYTLDLQTNELVSLGERNSSIDPKKMAVTEPYELKMRDGKMVQAFVTFPSGSSRTKLPLVVLPHGGPMGVYDSWEYDSTVQLLASRGFAVLRVNFRGSGNYGKMFEIAGYKQWGRAMQDDLTDATRWAVETGVADGRRICIYGDSYGGYAALMGVMKEPSLYRCAVGNVGVYDLKKVMSDAGGAFDLSRNVLDTTIGREGLDQISPVKLAAKVQVPVLLFAGEEDFIAPVEHSKDMHAALLAAGKSSQLITYPREGHGNFFLKNRRDFAEKLVAFLEANTK